jgi:hypothetical protein
MRSRHRLPDNRLVPKMHPIKVAKSQHGLLVGESFQFRKILYKLHSTLYLSVRSETSTRCPLRSVGYYNNAHQQPQ